MPIIREHMPVGIIVRRSPGVTRWAKWFWKIVGVIPGAEPANWREIRREGDVADYHAATLTLEVFSSDTEAYLLALGGQTPGLTVVMDASPGGEMPWKPRHVGLSGLDGLIYDGAGEALVEIVPMPATMIAWLQRFCDQHHVEEPFIKRKRGKRFEDKREDGKGDARIRQMADVYRAPRAGLAS